MRDPNRRRRGANSAGSAERTRILVPAEQGNRVRIPDTERSQPFGFAGSESGQRAIRAGTCGRLPKVAVFLKHCFHAEQSARGENRSLEGLSWPGEKAEAMRLREKEDAVSATAGLHAHEWISQKTYKKQNRRSAIITAGSCEVKKLSKDLHSEDLSQKR